MGVMMATFAPTRPLVALGAALLVFGLALTASAQDGGELSAQELIDQAMERNALGFDSGRAQITLIVYDRAGERRERRLDVRSRRADERGATRVELTDPPEVRGQSFLFVEQAEGQDDVWMYVPAFNVTRRVEGRQKRGAFLGTHFTFADLESRDLREATYRRLPDETIGQTPVYVIEARPTDASASDYSRVVTYLRKEDQIPMRTRFFGKDGELEKTLFSEKLNTAEGGRSYIEQMTLRSEQGGYTTIVINALDPNVELPESVFSREDLGR
ncbi:outer membrane lipoprotein-sorting protein [Lujinxingia sediminis]|uniref:Outer membrane lipoprotein-sorting protein n=2 Tax=Lujinxingia sediminis TaxID=2480984 RepID=A0ABY0CR50_9DELT|nr:outer membrane lipoprotein-sorting protein [Lujinxingia sediminis]